MGPKAEGQDEFIEFWQRTCNKVRAYMFCACRNCSDAQDLTQDCFMRALRSWSAFQGTGSRQAWLFAIAHSTQVDWLRKEHRQRRAFEERTGDEGQAAAMDPNGDDAEVLWQAVERLRREQREVVHLKFVGGLSYMEIAETLGVPIGTVRSRLFRGLQALRGLIEE
jgi:RNA polymerase sigma-70 factor, ECF subfamily